MENAAILPPQKVTMKTWDDIEKAALTDPVLHQAVALVHLGQMTQIEALIAAALSLSEWREATHRELMKWVNRTPRPIVITPPEK